MGKGTGAPALLLELNDGEGSRWYWIVEMWEGCSGSLEIGGLMEEEVQDGDCGGDEEEEAGRCRSGSKSKSKRESKKSCKARGRVL